MTELSRYFTSIGFHVMWDGKLDFSESWIEIYDAGRLLCQVSDNTPLEAFLVDLPHYVRGAKKGIAPADYWARCPAPENFQVLLDRVRTRDPARYRKIAARAREVSPENFQSPEWCAGFAAAIETMLRLDGSSRLASEVLDVNDVTVTQLERHLADDDARALRAAKTKLEAHAPARR